MDRTGLEFIVSLRNKNSSHCHLDIIHGSGARSFETARLLRPQIYEDATGIVNGYGRWNRISGCRGCSRIWEAWASRRRSMETMQSTKTFDSVSEYT